MMSEFLLRPGNEGPLAWRLRQLLGVSTFEQVIVITPQFERTDGRTVVCRPKTAAHLDDLKKLPHEILLDIGLGTWQATEKEIFYLFPVEWYNCIPEGYPIVDICGNEKEFEFGVTDRDQRYGFLAFGFVRRREGKKK